MVSEAKIDDSFPVENFLMDGFSIPYRLDRDSMVGGMLLYVREDIPSNLLSIETKPIGGFYIELNLRNDKWLMNCSYKPHKNMMGNHLPALSENLDLHTSTNEKFVFMLFWKISM